MLKKLFLGFGVGGVLLVLGGFGVGVFFAIEAVHHFDDNKDSEGDDEEIDDVLNKIAISDVSDGVGTEEVGNVDGEGREVGTTSKKASNGHNDVVD